MEYAAKIRMFDLEAAERKAIEEAEARHIAHTTQKTLGEIRDAVLAMDALLVGYLMRVK